MRKGSRWTAWAVALTLLVAGGLASARAAGFLVLDGVEGEAEDANHQGWIEIQALSHGMTRWDGDGDRLVAPPLSTGSTGAGELTVSRLAESPLSALYMLCIRGKELEEARIDLCTGKGRKRSCVEYVLSGVIIEALEVGRPKGDRPTETLTLSFSKMKWYPAVPGSALPPREDGEERAKR